MTWSVLLCIPAVLVVLLLFGFVGCSFQAGTADIAPIALWKLSEVGLTAPTSGGAAMDSAGTFNGDYFKLQPVAAIDSLHHSPDTAGTITIGDIPGILELHSDEPCVIVDGGFVRVPANDTLNPGIFTFECWIDFTTSDYPPGNPDNNYYCLVETTGPSNMLDPRSTGFGLYFGPKDASTPGYFWQVWMGDGTQFQQAAVAAQPMDAAQMRLTYLALTFNGNNNSVKDDNGNDLGFNLALYTYRPDTGQDLTVAAIQALNSIVNSFEPNTGANGGGGDFFIGTGSNLFPNVPPAFVQVAAFSMQTTTQSVPVEYPSAQTAGNLNIVVVSWRDNAANVQSVQDSTGNAYVLAVGPTTSFSTQQVQQSIYFASDIFPTNPTGSNTVTVTFDRAAKNPDIRILEYAGVAGAGALDQTSGAGGRSKTPQCGPVTTTAANELIFAANTNGSSVQGAGSGFTSRVITAQGNLAEDQIASAIGSFTGTAPLTATANWVMQMATFRAGPSQRLYPFKGKIQEVALYDADLSVAGNNVLSLQNYLGPHEAAGGNL